jgi:site-specific DNA recombinase
MSRRAAWYARVSTARQEQEKTVASQLEALERATSAMGLTVPPERRYIDNGVSGSRLDRPGLDALRDAAADGLVDLVFVYCPDRLARNYVHQHVLIEELNRRGVEVHFVEHPVTERAEDRLLVQMQGVIAEYERAKIIERTRRGKLHKLRTGQMLPYGSEAPYGYALVRLSEKVPRTVVIDEVEAQAVRAMYRWVLEDGLSARGVAKRLSAEGVRTRRGKMWTQSTVYNVLTSPAYAGQATWGRREDVEPKRVKKPGAHRRKSKSSFRTRPREQWLTVPIPPLVDEAMQQRVRTLLAKHKVVSPRNVQHEYLLRTLVVCGECGWRMECLRHAPPHTKHEYFYYACRRNDPTTSEQKCTARRVRREELDGVVWDAIVSWIQSPEMLRHEIEAWRSSQEGDAQRTQDLARLESAERRLQGQVERLVDAYQAGGITVDELKARRARLEAEKEAAHARRQELLAQEKDRARLGRLGEDLAAFAATLRTGLDKLDFLGRQRLVRLLLERVVVTGDHVAIEHAIPLSGRFGGLRPQDRRASLSEV